MSTHVFTQNLKEGPDSENSTVRYLQECALHGDTKIMVIDAFTAKICLAHHGMLVYAE